MVLGHGQVAQMLHRDGDSWGHFPAPRPEILVSVNVALTDFTQDNGATVVVPGSHKWAPGREAKTSECTKAVMARGSALLYSGNVIHGGGANNTDDIRIGFYCGLLLSWLRPIENQLITTGAPPYRRCPRGFGSFAATQKPAGTFTRRAARSRLSRIDRVGLSNCAYSLTYKSLDPS